MARTPKPKTVETLTHDEATRVNIPTAEYEAVLDDKHRTPIQVAYLRRNPDLDPQLVWRGKDVLDWSELVVQAPPLFIQEKVHPKVLIDDLVRRSKESKADEPGDEFGLQPNLFAHFNGLPTEDARTEFYQHDANWSNRMILGDSLQVMASLAEREGLRGKVQCIYIDPPYGIMFNSNWQWSTTSRDVRDGKADHMTREPEQVKAYRLSGLGRVISSAPKGSISRATKTLAPRYAPPSSSAQSSVQSRPDLVEAAREAAEAGFDILISFAFSYNARSTDLAKLGRIPILKARMNADLHMADDLKNTGKGNLFVIFGEPDIDILETDDDQIQVKLNGVDVYHPNTGQIRSDNADGIACWFIDTDYNEESFFVRHAYFLGANDPYKSLKTTLRAEINQEAWETLHSDTSRPFDKPTSGRVAIKVINHLGDEVMKVFRV